MKPLSDDERVLLRSATREALSGRDWLAAAREALDGALLPDGWLVAAQAGWPGLLIAEQDGGAGLGAAEALLVMRELGRAVAGIPLFGHLVATALIAPGVSPATGSGSSPDLGTLATGERRAVWLPSRPEADGSLSVDPVAGPRRRPGLRLDAQKRVSGAVAWVPDAPAADVLVGVATDPGGRHCTVLVAAEAAEIDQVASYDGSRRLAHVRLGDAPATCLAAQQDAPETSWALAQALLGAEALGAAERLLELSVEHARRRFAFGRAIGSFQAVKHQLVEVLRRIESARALAERAGESLATGQTDAYTVACALRFSGGDALDCASRTAIAVHGGMGATWEHPAAPFFRRAQVTRRLLAGQAGAAAEVGRRLLTAA